VEHITRLIFQFLALGDVTHHSFDPQRVAKTLRARGDFHPNRRAIDTSQAQQVILDRTVTAELGEESVAGKRIDESIEIERPKVGRRQVIGPSDDQPQVWICGECGRAV
jgi:hypothetical protein